MTVFLQLARPVGTPVDLSADVDPTTTPLFVRDTTGSVLETDRASDLDVALPPDARPTGFGREGNSISVDPRRQRVHVTRPDGHTERWARLAPATGCG